MAIISSFAKSPGISPVMSTEFITSRNTCLKKHPTSTTDHDSGVDVFRWLKCYKGRKHTTFGRLLFRSSGNPCSLLHTRRNVFNYKRIKNRFRTYITLSR